MASRLPTTYPWWLPTTVSRPLRLSAGAPTFSWKNEGTSDSVHLSLAAASTSYQAHTFLLLLLESMMDLELAYTRPQKTAEQLGKLAEDRHRFLHKTLLLTGEPKILLLPNGRHCFLDSLSLAIRICANVSVYLNQETEDLKREAEDLAKRISFGKKVEFLRE